MDTEQTWDNLSEAEREDIFRYLKLMKIFTKDNSAISKENKKWMLERCTIPTELVPDEFMGRFWL